MDYWFFFSYAHADDNHYLRIFYKDLDGAVRQLTGTAPAQIGFLDRDKIAHGATWDAALEEALKNCRVFVPVYSASFFLSQYCGNCGKEIAVFRKRLHDYLKQQGVAIADPLILPVLRVMVMSRMCSENFPRSSIQYKHGSYPAEYTSEGVSQIVKLGVTPNSKYYNEY